MRVRWMLAIIVGLIVAAITGGLAWALSPVAPELSGIVFASAALPLGLTLGWVITVAPKTVPADAHAAESVESSWLSQALGGTSTDIVLVVGLALTAVSLTRVEVPTQLVLLGILLLAFASTAIRYAVARVRAVRA